MSYPVLFLDEIQLREEDSVRLLIFIFHALGHA